MRNPGAGIALALTCVGLLGAGAGCGAGGSPERQPAADRAYLEQAGREWDTLFNSGQSIQLARLYAESVVSMPFNRPNLNGRQALQSDFEKFFSENERARHETIVDELIVTADAAIERARYTLRFTPKATGKDVLETGRHVMCRKLVDGRWQIVWEIFNTDQ